MDKRDNQGERVRFMAKLPPDLHRWLKVAAAERGANMNDVLVAALDSARMRLGDGEGRQS
jgi:predicted HicB family RNase H-like nuclease